MMQPGTHQTDGLPVEGFLREELVRGDMIIDSSGPILRHLLVNDGQALFSDEIVARVRGMLDHIAAQLLMAQAEALNVEDAELFVGTRQDLLVAHLVENAAVLSHLHALAVEWQLTERLKVTAGIDPVLPPLSQALIASDDNATAANAMAMLAAQARFVQQAGRMEMPLIELPGDLFHTALLTLRNSAEETEDPAAAAAEARLRANFEESGSRLGLASRLVTSMGSGAMAALSLSHAGVAMFLTALGIASEQPRSVAIMATNDRQLARLALSLRASGMKPSAIEEQFALIHPDIVLPADFDELRADRAASILAASAPMLAG